MRNAKIVCTLGPATAERSTIADLAEAGMSIARLNASHGTVEERRSLLGKVRSVEREVQRPIGTMLDLRGPEIRTAEPAGPVRLEVGDEVRFARGDTVDPPIIGLTVDLQDVETGTRILLDDGRIETVVATVEEDYLVATVKSGGTFEGRSGVNVPGVRLGVDVVTPADEADLDLAAEGEVDFIAASFVADADDVLAVGEALERRGVDIPIIAKVELDAARRNIDEIIDASYGVMIARGDLGVECPLEEVPMIQKQLIRRCHHAGVPVITATEMLDSMVHSSRPTRAEASDVANAVLDGTDAVMLSGETAIGDRPVATVQTMVRIIRTTEASEEYDDLLEQRVPRADRSNIDALARSARYLARDLGAQAIVVASESGFTALKVAKFRPGVPIVAVTPDESVRR
ncbi:MAG: pyruvate kinase, partial [Halobacteriota archaeon]